jgi:hypothetical protein
MEYFGETNEMGTRRLAGPDGASDSLHPPTGTYRTVFARCVCKGCGWSWAPRNGGGGRCPKCGSWERADSQDTAASMVSGTK